MAGETAAEALRPSLVLSPHCASSYLRPLRRISRNLVVETLKCFCSDSIGYEDVPANISSSHICFFSVPERCHVLFDVDPLPALSLYILFASYYETCALTYLTCAPRPIPAEVPGEVPGVIARIAFTWLYAMREYLGINVIILDLRGIIVFQNVGIS